MPEKKKQHFVPRFYLRNFSHSSSGRAISIFNIASSKFIQSGNLKDQAYKNYFYGHDLTTENALSILEGAASEVIKNIVSRNSIPLMGSEEHSTLLIFIIFLSLRTVYIVDQLNEFADKFIKNILSKDSALPVEMNQLNFTFTKPIQMALNNAALSVPLTLDLHFKIVINGTKDPFITSDHPVVLYNQFLETRKRYGSNTGFASKGLEIFFPISPQHLLVFFGSNVYKVGDKTDFSTIRIAAKNDVNSLNLLQCLSANENLYFNEEVSESQIQRLMIQTERHRRKTKANVDEYLKEKNAKEMRIILHMYRTDIKCSLLVSFIRILKKAKQYSLGGKAVHVRSEEICRIHERFVELAKKGRYKAADFPKFLKDISSSTS